MPVAKNHVEQESDSMHPSRPENAPSRRADYFLGQPHHRHAIAAGYCTAVGRFAGVDCCLCVFPATHFAILLRRTRWIMFSLLLIYAYATPGVAVWAPLAQFSPTHEGLADGLIQLFRLAFALGGLAILLGLLSQAQLIGGLYALAYPLRYLGLSRERIAVRLALTLEYAESAILDSSTNWRANIEQMLAPAEIKTGKLAPAEIKQESIELHLTPFTLRDGLLLILAGVFTATAVAMRIALGVEYDGSQFFGWQSQAGGHTVQDALQTALSNIAGGKHYCNRCRTY